MRLWEPSGWEACTGVAGRGDGCNRIFKYKEEAEAYLSEHESVGVMGGYVQPLYALPRFMFKNPFQHQAVIRPPLDIEPI